MKKLYILIISICVGLAIIIFILYPRSLTKENSVSVNGQVSRVIENKQGGVTLSLENKRGLYYFPKEKLSKISIDSLKMALLNKEVVLFYQKPHFLAGLSPQSAPRRITEIHVGGKILLGHL